jgi:hypothetical protein
MEFLMSRSTHSNAAKLTDELRVAVDEDLKAALSALAVMTNKALAEYVRDVLNVHVHGSLAYVRGRMSGAEQRKE